MKSTLIPAVLALILTSHRAAPCRAEGVIVQWEHLYNGPANGEDSPRSIAVDSVGNVIVTGYSRGVSGSYDIYTAKYAKEDGNLIWERSYNGPANGSEIIRAVAVDSSDNVIVTGFSRENRNDDLYTAKYAASNGAVLWEKRYNGPANGPDDPSALAVDSAGNVIVSGSITTYGVSPLTFRYDGYTAKYAEANGALLWEKFYSATSDPLVNDTSGIVVVDSADNVICACGHYTSRNSSMINLVKYGSENGALLWSALHSSGSGGHARLAVDSTDNVILTAAHYGANAESDILTAKYAATDGALLWDKRYDGPGSGNDIPSDLAVDSGDNVIVTGTSIGSEGNGDIYIAKYAALDGALIWQRLYSIPYHDQRKALLDNKGHLVVVNQRDFFVSTAKYAPADGALLWEVRDNGTRNLTGHIGDVIIDREGSVIVAVQTNVPSGGGDGDFYTVKYVSADSDDDGLLDSWEIARFGGIAGQGALDDTDRDGVVELLELAFGSDPRKPDGGATPTVAVEDGYLTATIIKQAGVTYLVETGAMLNGDFSATSTTVLPTTEETLKVRDNVPIGTQPARFLRVQVTAAP